MEIPFGTVVDDVIMGAHRVVEREQVVERPGCPA